MEKSILVYSNGEKIGDGIIKLPLLHEIRRRLKDYEIVWMTDKGSTVYNSVLKNIANQYIDKFFEKADLKPFFWQNISDNYDLNSLKFNFILDTQKAVIRTIALKRIKCLKFISATANGFFSDQKIIKKTNEKIRQYYLDDIFDLLDLINEDKVDKDFKIQIPAKLKSMLNDIFFKHKLYIGIAPGAGEINKIWPIKQFLKVAKYFENQSYNMVFFLGPQEESIKGEIINNFPNAIFPEEIIKDFSGPEVVMASTQFLSCALSNDSGVSHMLSTNYCPLVKLFGPKDANKFTPNLSNLHTISSTSFNSNMIEKIPSEFVINKMNNLLS